MENETDQKAWPKVQALVSMLVPVKEIERIGFVKAAKGMGLSLQGLHNRLDRLAKELEVERGEIVTANQGATISPIGECLQRLCDAIVSDVTVFYAQLKIAKGDLPKLKEVRLAIVSSIWEAEKDWMSRAFADRDVKLDPQPSVALVAEAAITRGEADVAINYAPEVLDTELEKKDWRKEPMVLVASSGCQKTWPEMFTPRGRPKPATVEDIRRMVRDREFYVMGKGSPMNVLVMSYLAGHGIEIQERIVQTVEEAISLINENEGISILPIANAEKDRETKHLASFPLKRELVRRISIIYPVISSKRKEVDIFRDYILQHDKLYPAKKAHLPSKRSR